MNSIKNQTRSSASQTRANSRHLKALLRQRSNLPELRHRKALQINNAVRSVDRVLVDVSTCWQDFSRQRFAVDHDRFPMVFWLDGFVE